MSSLVNDLAKEHGEEDERKVGKGDVYTWDLEDGMEILDKRLKKRDVAHHWL